MEIPALEVFSGRFSGRPAVNFGHESQGPLEWLSNHRKLIGAILRTTGQVERCAWRERLQEIRVHQGPDPTARSTPAGVSAISVATALVFVGAMCFSRISPRLMYPPGWAWAGHFFWSRPNK